MTTPTDNRDEATASWCVVRGGSESDRLAAIARCEADGRRRRNRLIRYQFFAEPAWDMLLELYIRRHGGQTTDVANLCDVSGVAMTTALRWVGLLIETGLVNWTHPSFGETDVQLSLSEAGTEEIERYLRDALRRAEAVRGS